MNYDQTKYFKVNYYRVLLLSLYYAFFKIYYRHILYSPKKCDDSATLKFRFRKKPGEIGLKGKLSQAFLRVFYNIFSKKYNKSGTQNSIREICFKRKLQFLTNLLIFQAMEDSCK